ncbi:MAG TPA: GDP-mannose 4,6-dehydratase [Longimicrobiales bacterium]
MKPEPETIVVTGAAGFIGSHLCERLLARGDRVIGIDNFDPFYARELKLRNLEPSRAQARFRFVEADCAEPDQMAAVFTEPVSAIVHLAAKAGVRPSIADPMGYTRANIVATQVMLECARQHDIARFIFGSSSSVYGNNEKVPFSEDDPVDRPISPYAATKRACELVSHSYHHLFGIGVLSLRFFTVYGPRQRPDLAIRKFSELMLRAQEIPFFGAGTSERDYTWIDDIIQGVVAAIDRSRAVPGEFEIINLGESRTTSLGKLVDLIAAALHVEPKLRRLPMQPGDVNRTFADVSKARQLLDYQPATPVEIGIPRFVEWLKTELSATSSR